MSASHDTIEQIKRLYTKWNFIFTLDNCTWSLVDVLAYQP